MLSKWIYSILNKKDLNHNKYLSFIGGILIYFCLGGVTIWGYINIYITSYFHNYQSDLTYKKANLIFTLMCFPLCLSSFFSLQLANKIGFKFQIRLCTLIYSLAVIISSFCSQFSYFLIFYGFFCALGAGLSYTPIIYIMWSYFPEKRGRISGYMFGMFGLTCMLLVPIISYFINPENLKINSETGFFDIEVSNQTPKILQYLGVFYLIGTSIGTSLIKEPEIIIEYSRIIKQDEENGLNNKSIKCKSLKEGLNSFPFRIIYLNAIFLAIFSFFLHINFKKYGLSLFNDDHFVSLAGFFNGAGGLAGRIIFGYILDKTEFKKLYTILFFLVFSFSITFSFFSYFKFGYIIWIFILASLDGGITCIIGPGLIHIFGLDVGSKLYPIKGSAFYVSMLFVPFAHYFFLNIFKEEIIFNIFAIGNGIAFGLTFLIKNHYNWE